MIYILIYYYVIKLVHMNHHIPSNLLDNALLVYIYTKAYELYL
jgi:hypothetical protein